jgi:hypothetical protein
MQPQAFCDRDAKNLDTVFTYWNVRIGQRPAMLLFDQGPADSTLNPIIGLNA